MFLLILGNNVSNKESEKMEEECVPGQNERKTGTLGQKLVSLLAVRRSFCSACRIPGVNDTYDYVYF